MTINDLEWARENWAKIAKANGWYTEPFYVQVWLDADGTIVDSVSHKGLTQDYVIPYEPCDCESEDCDG